jgi:hypothetical protein
VPHGTASVTVDDIVDIARTALTVNTQRKIIEIRTESLPGGMDRRPDMSGATAAKTRLSSE